MFFWCNSSDSKRSEPHLKSDGETKHFVPRTTWWGESLLFNARKTSGTRLEQVYSLISCSSCCTFTSKTGSRRNPGTQYCCCYSACDQKEEEKWENTLKQRLRTARHDCYDEDNYDGSSNAGEGDRDDGDDKEGQRQKGTPPDARHLDSDSHHRNH